MKSFLGDSNSRVIIARMALENLLWTRFRDSSDRLWIRELSSSCTFLGCKRDPVCARVCVLKDRQDSGYPLRQCVGLETASLRNRTHHQSPQSNGPALRRQLNLLLASDKNKSILSRMCSEHFSLETAFSKNDRSRTKKTSNFVYILTGSGCVCASSAMRVPSFPGNWCI